MTERQQIRFLLQATGAEALTSVEDITAPSSLDEGKRMTRVSKRTVLHPLVSNLQPPKTVLQTPKPAPKSIASVPTGSDRPTFFQPKKREYLCSLDHVKLQMVAGEDHTLNRPILGKFKRIADELLPEMRRDAHLHNLIFSRNSHTLLLTRLLNGSSAKDTALETESSGVVGGVTFRLPQHHLPPTPHGQLIPVQLSPIPSHPISSHLIPTHSSHLIPSHPNPSHPVPSLRLLQHSSSVVAVVLAVVVDQAEGTCRRGYGTALIDALKASPSPSPAHTRINAHTHNTKHTHARTHTHTHATSIRITTSP